MDRAQKAESIEALKSVFDGAGAVVVTHYLGLTVANMNDLRARLREEGASLKVVKNRLAQKALNGSGDNALALFKGPVAIAYANDPVAAAKVTAQYAKDNENFKVIGALMGEDVLDAKAPAARSAAWQDRRPVAGPGDQDRRRVAGPGRRGRPRYRRLCRQRNRSRLTQ